MSTIKVFAMNEGEWWAGESLQACCAEARRQTGCDREGTPPDERQYPSEGFGHVLSADDMARLVVVDTEGPQPLRRSFAEQFAMDVDAGAPFPCLFAATDY